MHHQVVKSNVVDSNAKRDKLGSGGYDQPLCPKPQRISPAIPEFLKPLKCTKHRFDCIYSFKQLTWRHNSDGKESICNGFSPPRRSENPLVHDVEFLRQMELVSPFAPSDKFGFASPI
ncbi:hypothetical protein L6164_027596 [Bauhinia variegata]|uniref:Uncharacterized protein n=1 Tax=Bauhinia variegata TaxID=167791 RepID=A0ACB9LTM9_BAUVA|nr:hypothetical protein L6164_027596 [Bauhinia variegata]